MKPQTEHALEVTDVAGEQHQVVGERGGSDEQIHVPDQLALGPKFAARAGKLAQDRARDRQHPDDTQKRAKALLVRAWIPAEVDALVNLPLRDRADR